MKLLWCWYVVVITIVIIFPYQQCRAEYRNDNTPTSISIKSVKRHVKEQKVVHVLKDGNFIVV